MMTLELAPNLAGLEPFEPAKDLKALVACESSVNAQEACTLLERLGRNSESDGRLFYSWWNFEVLTITSLRKLAANEAAAANLIIIAAQAGPKLPEQVVDWISLWLTLGEYHSRALVALVDSETTRNSVSSGILSQLKKVAELGQMGFFTKGTETKLAAALARGSAPPPGNSSWHPGMGIAGISGWSGTAPARI